VTRGHRPFPIGVVVVNDEAQARASTGGRPFQHSEIAVGVAERQNGPAADMLVDADRLPGLVVDEIDFRQARDPWVCRP
jgi:hypothetical protein